MRAPDRDPDDPPAAPTRKSRLEPAAGAVTAFWATGRVAGETHWVADMLAYIPSPFVTALLAFVAIRSQRHRTAWFALAAIPLATILFVENRFHSPPRSTTASRTEDAVRLVHWNVCRGLFGWNSVCESIRAMGADLVVLSEVPRRAATMDLEPFHRARIMHGQAIAARSGQLRLVEDPGEGEPFSARLWEWLRTPAGTPLRILVVDIRSDPTMRRQPQIQAIWRIVERLEPDLVVGDFNTPRQSRWVQDLPIGYRHAYDAAGSGWSYTWPLPLPVFALDQCIVGPRVLPIEFELFSSVLSDHRGQHLTFARGTKRNHDR